MQINRETYHRFLNGECSDHEQAYCIQYFQEHPEELEQLMDSLAWEQFTPAMQLPAAISEQMQNRIRKRINKRRRVQLLQRVLAAAVCIGIIIIVVHRPAIVNPPVIVQQLDTVVTNHTQAGILITLSDQSIVELYPGSALKYKKLFDQRDLYLKGDARFDVHKDNKRPFTVYASGIAVTALGTSFRVTEGTAVKVKLFTGKVVVKAAAIAPVYLQPGQEVNIRDTIVSLIRPKKHFPPAIPTKKTTAPSLAFDKQPLEEVIQQLQHIYPIKVRYDKHDIQEVQVTAVFDEHDSPETILDLLCTLNYLTLTKEKGEFIISK